MPLRAKLKNKAVLNFGVQWDNLYKLKDEALLKEVERISDMSGGTGVVTDEMLTELIGLLQVEYEAPGKDAEDDSEPCIL